jgi:8-oxo-dGTP pyrophosphatase MutT (NUDIX family)
MVLLRAEEVLLLRRAKSMQFAPGMHVFPGGRVDPADLSHPDPVRACAQRETWEEVRIRVDSCVLIDRWVTPELEERRYDVSFFLATTHETGRLSTTEADDFRWLTPSEALDRHGRGELPMLRPTSAVLQGLLSGEYDDPGHVTAKLPRLRNDGSWDVVDVESGHLLASGIEGPARAETDGNPLP